MPKYIELYHKALKNYIVQAERSHYSLKNIPNKPIYTFGFFSWIRHSHTEYDALKSLRAKLEKDTTANQTTAITEIKKHFEDKNNKWNNHSFNNYLLDEIKNNITQQDWEQHWQQFDKAPIVYYQGLLFRGAVTHPSLAFVHGIAEFTSSPSIDDYIADMNGCVGVSTSKKFDVACSYALPTIHPNRDYEDVRNEAYIYVIDYDGESGIDLQKTFNARGRKLAAWLSGNKSEVNVIHKILPEAIIGAFYINRNDEIKWHANAKYHHADSANVTAALLTRLPTAFKKAMNTDVSEPIFKPGY